MRGRERKIITHNNKAKSKMFPAHSLYPLESNCSKIEPVSSHFRPLGTRLPNDSFPRCFTLPVQKHPTNDASQAVGRFFDPLLCPVRWSILNSSCSADGSAGPPPGSLKGKNKAAEPEREGSSGQWLVDISGQWPGARGQ